GGFPVSKANARSPPRLHSPGAGMLLSEPQQGSEHPMVITAGCIVRELEGSVSVPVAVDTRIIIKFYKFY
ncbi:hypothetical protein, partial [Paenibacillus lautus]